MNLNLIVVSVMYTIYLLSQLVGSKTYPTSLLFNSGIFFGSLMLIHNFGWCLNIKYFWHFSFYFKMLSFLKCSVWQNISPSLLYEISKWNYQPVLWKWPWEGTTVGSFGFYIFAEKNRIHFSSSIHFPLFILVVIVWT